MDDKGGTAGPVAGAGGGMPPGGKAVAAAVREQRLKAALKANMARRKAQAKARSSGSANNADADMTGVRGADVAQQTDKDGEQATAGTIGSERNR